MSVHSSNHSLQTTTCRQHSVKTSMSYTLTQPDLLPVRETVCCTGLGWINQS